MQRQIKIALVHDWLVTIAGAERVLAELISLYPEADLFAMVDFLSSDERKVLQHKRATTSIIQRLPFAKRKYRYYLPLMPLAVEQFDLSSYDLIISCSHAVAKGVITSPDQVHICYCHSPMRYAWDLQHQYLKEAGLQKGIASACTRLLLHYMRLWDSRTANSVDYFIANSRFIASRIHKIYRRQSTVIYPPVDVEFFDLCVDKQDYYLTASRLVPYKKVSLIVEAFSSMPDKRLIVVGDGPEMETCKKFAKSNVQLLGYQANDELKALYQKAKAFVFAANEDFGIAPVEAQACGTPVIAYGKGGALETVSGLNSNHPTGLFFPEQTICSIVDAVHRFEAESKVFDPGSCRDKALEFSSKVFLKKFDHFVQQAMISFNEVP